MSGRLLSRLGFAVICIAATSEPPHGEIPPATLPVAAATASSRGVESQPSITARMAQLPLRFEANAGQWDERARFRSRGNGATLFVTDEGMTVVVTNAKMPTREPGKEPNEEREASEKAWREAKSAAVTLKLVGATPREPRGEEPLVTKSNFFIGDDPSKWRTNVPNFAQVRAGGWLPGVDVVWHGGASGLEYDLEVAPGVDATLLALEIEGAESLAITKDGALAIGTAAGTLVQRPPRVVQSGRELPAHHALSGKKRVSFVMDGYDTREGVLVDPVLTYSTYLGGSSLSGETGCGIAVDGSGNAYVTGLTASANFPTKSPLQSQYAGGWDVFVTKLNSTGSALVYSTYLGSSGDDEGRGIAVDGGGNAYVTGATTSTNFPTQSPFQSAFGGGAWDAFVAKLNSSGSALVYSTYLGGSGYDFGFGIAVDASGSAYITGQTASTSFPKQSALQGTYGGGTYDAFVTKLGAAGTSLVYSTYLGGSVADYGYGIAVDSGGNAYVTGLTSSTNFPTKSPLQSALGGPFDAFVTKLSASGSSVYSTYLGGSSYDEGSAIAVDGSGDAYVTGNTSSTTFPKQSAFQAAYGGGTSDAFVTKLGAAGTSLVYSTYLGGSGDEQARGIAVDGSGSASVTGQTTSADFPTKSSIQSAIAGVVEDVFVTKLGATGTALVYSTYLGGLSQDMGFGIAVDSSGSAHVTGLTYSTDFPTQSPLQSANGGSEDAFVAEVADPELPVGTSCKQDGDCASLHCVDGVCCDSACTDQCGACDVSGKVGTCSPVTGAPHGSRTACAKTSACSATCDGTNTKACTFAPDVCMSTCSNAVENDTLCDTSGNCTVPKTHSCNNLVCADATKCKVKCATDADCVTGFACAPDGTCQPGATCVDTHTSKGANGTVQDCTPYVCDTSGACKIACASVDDCTSPNVCDPNGKCVPPPPSGGSGCSCNAGSEGSAPWATALLTLGVASILVRRSRRQHERPKQIPDHSPARPRRYGRRLRSATSALKRPDFPGGRFT